MRLLIGKESICANVSGQLDFRVGWENDVQSLQHVERWLGSDILNAAFPNSSTQRAQTSAQET